MMTPDILEEYMTQWKNQLYAGGVLASIDSFDKSTMTAKVNPLYKVKQEDTMTKLPILVNVPVVDFCAGKWTITFDYKKGDIVMLIPNAFQTNNALKGMVDLATDTRYQLENVIVISGIRKRPIIPNPSIPTAGLIIAHEDGDYFQCNKDQIKLKSKKVVIDGDVEVTGKLDVTKTSKFNDNMEIAGTLDVTNDITSDTEVVAGTTQVKLSKHGHTTVLGPTIPPVIPMLG